MLNQLNTICVYCGSADGLKTEYLEAAFQMGEAIAREGITLVFGAGKTGLMGALADGALQARGIVIGVVDEYLNQPQLIHAGLTRLEVTSNMHQRKARMSDLADAFIALPGGFGTLDELFETLTWLQIGLHQKPVGLLNTKHYFDPLLNLIDHALEEGFIYNEHRELLFVGDTPISLLDKLRHYRLPDGLDRWVSR
jgi:hypothetical protein